MSVISQADRLSGTSASEAGFRWVAEWEPHDATWIAWPHNLETWPNRFEPIPRIFEALIRSLAEVEKVHVLGGPTMAHQLAAERLGQADNIFLHPITTDDCWVRDYGPTFVVNPSTRQLGAVNWIFNTWGNKYPAYEEDAINAQRMAESIDCRRFNL
jgi:agmatine deiminase